MTNLTFITEESAKQLIESNVNSNSSKGYVLNPAGFSKHLIETGRIGYRLTKEIMEKHPSLCYSLNPNFLRVYGYMHDFSKIFDGGEFHEVGTAHLILTKGDKDFELVAGGTESDRKRILREIAFIVPPDFALFESLGGRNYPNNSPYPDKIDDFKERVEQLRRELSPDGKYLSIEELGLPFTLNQQIGLYADLTNVNGEIISVSDRIDEVEQRYGDPAGKFYNPIYADLAKKIRPRVLVVGATIENLLR